MKFFKWIEKQGGCRQVAKMVDKESPTVRAWLERRATPRVSMMKRLVKLGRGAFTYNDIISETTKTSNR